MKRFLFVLLFSLSTFAIDSRLFLRFFTLEQIASQAELQEMHFKALQGRFANKDFDEILFPDHSAKGPRLDLDHHRLMIEAVNKFSLEQNYAERENYFTQRPNLSAFRVSRTPKTKEIDFSFPATNIGNWLNQIKKSFWNSDAFKIIDPASRDELVRLVSKRVPKVTSIFNLKPKDLVADPLIFDSVLKAYMDLSRVDKSQELLRSAAILVAAKWFHDNKILTIDFNYTQLSNIDLHLLKQELQSEIGRILKSHQLPSKLANNYFKFAGFEESFASPFPKDEAIIIPMTRWEAIFKGIGPGECIRASANRFFDAFYPFSQAFSVIKDGKELGYVGIYKVLEKDGNKRIWYIDTIQSPGLVSNGGDPWILDGVLDQIERLAIREGATLAIGATDWNGTNYKENIPRVHARGTIAEIEVSFPASDLLQGVYDFVAHKDQAHHQTLMKNSGYDDSANQMYDTLLRNSYKVRVLEPSARLSEGERAQYYRNFGLVNNRGKFAGTGLREFESLVEFGAKLPSNRLRLVDIFRQKAILFRNSPAATALANASIFPEVIRSLGHVPDSSEMDEVVEKIKTGTHTAPFELLLELLPLTKNDAQIISLIQTLLDKSQPELGSQIIDYVIPLLERKGFTLWNDLFSSIISFSPSDFVDNALAAELVYKTKNPDEFIRFITIAEGKEHNGQVSEMDHFTEIVVFHFLKHLKTIQDSEQRLKFLLDVKYVTRAHHDNKLVTSYFKQMRTYQEFIDLNQAITISNHLDIERSSVLLAKLFFSNDLPFPSKEVEVFLGHLDPESILDIVRTPEKFDRIVSLIDKKNWLQIYDLFLGKGRNDLEDMEIARKWATVIDNGSLKSFIAYSNGERSENILGKQEDRKKFFLELLNSRIKSERDSTVRAQMLLLLVNHYGTDIEKIFNSSNLSQAEFQYVLKKYLTLHFERQLNGTQLYRAVSNLLTFSSFQLDISDLFARVPAIGIKLLDLANKQGQQLLINPTDLQSAAKNPYLLPEERRFIQDLAIASIKNGKNSHCQIFYKSH